MNLMTPPISVLIASSDRDYADSLAEEMKAESPEVVIEIRFCTEDLLRDRCLREADVLIFDCNVLREPNSTLKDYLEVCTVIPCIALVDKDDIANLHLVLELGIETYLIKSRPRKELAKLIVQRTSSLIDLHRAEEIRVRTEKRLQALVELAQSHSSSFNEVVDFVLKKMLELTDSDMGYLAFVENHGRTLHMHAWSGKGLTECRLPHKPLLYSMDEVGIWGEPVRQGKPIVLNDFVAEHRLKKGTPTGHVQIDRFMAIPIYHNGTIVATAGVANKSSPYHESDVVQMGLLMDGIIAIQHGIEMRREVLEAQGKFQALLDSLPFTVVMLDERSCILSINRTPPGSDQSPEEIVGRCLSNIETDAGRQYNAIFQQAMEQNTFVRQEVLLELEQGRTIHLDASISPVPFENVGSRLYIATINDITDINKALMKVHKVTHRMQLIESTTYHDIFNQIQVVRGYLELMASDAGRSESELRMLSTVEKAAVSISKQIQMLREYYALGLTDPEWLDLEKELERAMEDSGLKPEMITSRCKGIQIFADSSFYKAIYNLYHNSFSHGKKVTAVSMDYEQLPDMSLKLIYRDNGVGIPTDDKEKIFQRGFGTHAGLGMFLTREILHCCDFKIEENGTEGARFEILIPPGLYRLPADPLTSSPHTMPSA